MITAFHGYGKDTMRRPGTFGDVSCKYIEYACGSDYSGGSVTLSNYRIIRKNAARFKGIYDIRGDFGSYGIAYIPSELTRKGRAYVESILDRLGDYASLDDEALSALELELVEDGFELDYRSELPQEDDETDAEYEARVELAREIVLEGMGDIAYPETGCVVYIKWETVKERLRAAR